MLKLYLVEYSTNVERVALALAHKGLEAESVYVPFDDRAEINRVSGQDLVPVLVDGDVVKFDSMEIVHYLGERFPETPPLYPRDPARLADCLMFIDWFNRAWKRPPNLIFMELSKPEGERNMERVERLGKVMAGYLDLFEQMLTGREYLQGEFSAADVAAFPFLKFATIPNPKSPHLFHRILERHQPAGSTHPRLANWITRVNQS